MAENINATENVAPEKAVVVGVSFREAGKVYYFDPENKVYSVGDKVIVETARGVEFGNVKLGNKEISASEIISPLKPIMRRATPEDEAKNEKNRRAEEDAAVICKKKIEAHGLGMNLTGVEYTFDNSKLIFYFTCESRVDFRELVKDLASTFRTRIELRQIGIRDEAKMMGGLGVCGRKFCCASFLSDFVQVSIKMAKEQNFSLNSAKVSGACGRLMCCLRYEHETYEEALKRTPPVGSVVDTKDGQGTVVETMPLAELIKVKLTDKDKDVIKPFAVSDVRVISRKRSHEAKEEEEIIPEDN